MQTQHSNWTLKFPRTYREVYGCDFEQQPPKAHSFLYGLITGIVLGLLFIG